MRSLIITVAGKATRFNKDLSSPTLKCLYYEGNYKNSLLYQIIEKAEVVDEIIIVGGYLFDDLVSFIETHSFPDKHRIKIIYNEHYITKGSGWSLYLGIREVSHSSEEIIFVEGDLYYSKEDFDKICQCENNVLTINREPILASKAVVVYINLKNEVKYLYDISHNFLEINEPFLAIFNSGQIWKFKNYNKLINILEGLDSHLLSGTNLVIIQKYFESIRYSEINFIDLFTWINCNTVNDYNKAYNLINGISEF